jgi:hypothetical protein
VANDNREGEPIPLRKRRPRSRRDVQATPRTDTKHITEATDAVHATQIRDALGTNRNEASTMSSVRCSPEHAAADGGQGKFKYMALRCWVKCELDGTPLQPLEVAGLAKWSDLVSTQEHTQSSLDGWLAKSLAINDARKQQEHANRADDNGCAIIEVPISRASSSVDPMPGSDIIVPIHTHPACGALVPINSVPNMPSLSDMLATLYKHSMEQKQADTDFKNWKDAIPYIDVKQAWLDFEAPQMKRENGVKRATTPKVFSQDCVSLPRLEQWLADKVKGKARSEDVIRGACRALTALTISDTTPIFDVKVLVGLYISANYTKLLKMELLHPKYNWTIKIIEGLTTYAAFWCEQLRDMQVKGDEVNFSKYQDCIDLLVIALKGGYTKRCRLYKEQSYSAKKKDDLHVLKNFPSIKDVIQPAVYKAYCVLRRLAEKYDREGHDSMSKKDRSLANCIIVGAWQCDTFLGRKWEIEHAEYDVVVIALENDTGYIIATKHKTQKTYGDIIKAITKPGLQEALRMSNFRFLASEFSFWIFDVEFRILNFGC